MYLKYIYDKSNRLLKDSALNYSDNTYNLINSYDNDGNILTLKRYGLNNNLSDNFNYSYYKSTNRLSSVSGNCKE